MPDLHNVARTHVAQAAGVSNEEVQHTPPCDCCGLHMQYAITGEGVFMHPWGDPFDQLIDVRVVRSRDDADGLIEHMANGPDHPINADVAKILNETFPRILA